MDLISRQAAIDAIDKALSRTFIEPCGDMILKAVPSVQSDFSELLVICDNCGHAIHIKRMDAQSTNEPEHPETMYYPQVDGITASVIAQPERKTGKWIRWYETKEDETGTEYIPHCRCSECGTEYEPHSSKFVSFCNVCGAKMEEGE